MCLELIGRETTSVAGQRTAGPDLLAFGAEWSPGRAWCPSRAGGVVPEQPVFPATYPRFVASAHSSISGDPISIASAGEVPKSFVSLALKAHCQTQLCAYM